LHRFDPDRAVTCRAIADQREGRTTDDSHNRQESEAG
jgi:hypothetical protein